jgi:hypothetical protein
VFNDAPVTTNEIIALIRQYLSLIGVSSVSINLIVDVVLKML